MYFKHLVWLIVMFCSVFFMADAAATPDTPSGVELHVTPDKCISLQQGRTCYSQVTASWRSKTPQDLCLMLQEQQLYCWQQQSSGRYQFEFAAPQSAVLQLRQQQHILQQVTIEVNWVHKASKTKRHWRLF
jgi:hypothetical protein